jgi:hypothetical protein
MKTVVKECRWPLLAVCVAALQACGVDDEATLAPDGDADTVVLQAQEEVLHAFDVGTQRVRLLRSTVPDANEDDAVLVQEWSGEIGTPDYQRVIEERYGELTPLELLETFGPAGEAPHPALVKAHQAQAETLGTLSADVHRFDPVEPSAICPGPEGTGQPCPELSACVAIGLNGTATLSHTPGLLFSSYLCAGSTTLQLASLQSLPSSCSPTFTSRTVTAEACAEDLDGGNSLGTFSTVYKTISTSGETVVTNSSSTTLGNNHLIRRRFIKASGISSHTVAAVGRKSSSTALMKIGTQVSN